MHPLAGRHEGADLRVVHSPDIIDKDARRVDHAARLDLELASGFHILGEESRDVVFLPHQSGAAHVVDQDCSVIGRRHGEMDREPGVIELTVVIHDAARQAFRLQRRQQIEHVLPRQVAGRLQAQLTREGVVHLQADPVKRPLPPVVARDDKRQTVHEVGRILAQQSALAQCLQNERDIALLEIPHTAVDQLRAAAGGPLGEVTLLDEHDAVTPRRCIDRRSQARRTAANDRQIKRFTLREAVDHFSAVHADRLYLPRESHNASLRSCSGRTGLQRRQCFERQLSRARLVELHIGGFLEVASCLIDMVQHSMGATPIEQNVGVAGGEAQRRLRPLRHLRHLRIPVIQIKTLVEDCPSPTSIPAAPMAGKSGEGSADLLGRGGISFWISRCLRLGS